MNAAGPSLNREPPGAPPSVANLTLPVTEFEGFRRNINVFYNHRLTFIKGRSAKAGVDVAGIAAIGTKS